MILQIKPESWPRNSVNKDPNHVFGQIQRSDFFKNSQRIIIDQLENNSRSTKMWSPILKRLQEMKAD